MKKSMFALACAASIAAFAGELNNTIGFEDYTSLPFTGLSFKDDTGDSSGSAYWLYLGGQGAEDGSAVKAYATEGVTPATDGGDNFLDLSTEGGTLWRSVAPLATTELNAGTAIPEGGLYVDTMVQFTPTEDGGAPELDPADKLAIWLNVETPEGATDPVTNLCVRAAVVDDEGHPTATTFTITNAGDIRADAWYHLKVEAIADITEGDEIPGFKIYLNDTLLIADQMTLTDDYAELKDLDDVNDKVVFASLRSTEANPTLSAVGFKGSGKLDNLTISDEDPTPAPEELIDLSITAANATVTGIEDGKVKAGDELSFKVAAEDGYTVTGVTINGNTVTADAQGNYTYTVAAEDTAVAVVVTTEAVQSIDWDHPKQASGTAAEMFGITGALAKADGQKLAAWATKNSINFSTNPEVLTDAFLLNCANNADAVTKAKEDFVIPSITIGADGTVTVTPPEGEYNGYIVIKGAATVDGTYVLAVDAPKAKFFKAFLVLEAPAAE